MNKRIGTIVIALTLLPYMLAATAISVTAPQDATYITQTANGVLSNEQALSSLSTGLVKVTTTTGVLSTATAGTDYYKTGSTTSGPVFASLFGTIASPAQNTTYFFGTTSSLSATSMTTTAARRRFYFPSAGTVTKAYITVINDGGTAGTSETSTLILRLNNSSDTTLSSSIVTNATGAFNNTSVGLAVSQGDYVELKWNTPTTWSTPPTSIEITVQLEFHP